MRCYQLASSYNGTILAQPTLMSLDQITRPGKRRTNSTAGNLSEEGSAQGNLLVNSLQLG